MPIEQLTQGTFFSGCDSLAQRPTAPKMLMPPSSQPRAPYLDTCVGEWERIRGS